MITESHGNLLQADTEALVNTVNSVGVMGKGIALQFKRAYPQNFKEYARACKAEEVRPGKMLVVKLETMTNPKYIINFPTKNHWRARSKIEDIESGLDDLVKVLTGLGVRSVAVPPLGCGNGGLDWRQVYPLIRDKLSVLAEVDVRVFPPEGAPPAEEMVVRSKRPSITRNRAAMLVAYDRYIGMALASGNQIEERLSVVEAQKVAYFLQLAGWPSGFDFNPSYYGPYAQTVDQWLSLVEGHFISGYGDGTSGSRAVLRLDAASVNEARDLLADDDEFAGVIARFEELVIGFEFPYGIELLSTVHYLIAADAAMAESLEKLVHGIGSWSRRKRELFQPRQAEIARDHLVALGAAHPVT
jgi:O-acetyl-ADP-ribose deacetylase (regulator of RNase III)/uncharacterized protein YwgA